MAGKIIWISILQGMAMFLVVLGHCWIWSDIQWFKDLCYGVHMPLFMFVSGGLFYLTRINKDWKWRDVITDKLKRLGVPYLFFITLAYGLKLLMAGKVKNDIDFSLTAFLQGFVYPMKSGMKEMWFVAALLLLMFCYPVYRKILDKKWLQIIITIMAIALTFIIDSYTGGGIFNWQGALRYLVFFWSGILFFQYDVIKFLKLNILTISIIFLLYAAICTFRHDISLIVAFVGIIGCVALSYWLSQKKPSIFSTFRDYSFQIFLLGIYPQMFVELILGKRFTESWQVSILLIMSIGGGIYFSVIVAKIVEKFKNKYLNMILGLK